jgi:hypothetical protein
MDHDQRFKTLIQMFFLEFLLLFFKPWADRLDAEAVVWIDKELFYEPPEGDRRVLDLVGKLPTKQPVAGDRAGADEHWMALVHIEIESPDKAAPLRPRMFEAYAHLRFKYRLPVLPIALFLRVGLDGIGLDIFEERFWELETVRFQYLYVGLPGLDAIKYVEGDNWLGVALAALMSIPKDRVAWLGAEALRRLQAAPLSDQKRYFLAECVEAYLPLDEIQKREFDQILATEAYKGARTMNVTTFEKGVEKGFEKGIETGRRDSLREALESRFGPLPTRAVAKLDQLKLDQIRLLQKNASKAESLKELGLDD